MTTALSLSAAIEAALNRYLHEDPRALEHCAALEGKVIAIDITVPTLSLYFLPDSNGVQVLGHYEHEPDTRLSGSPLGFARLSLGDEADALFSGVVDIRGDTETGQQFQELLAAIDWDWEEQLSRFTGDVVAHQIGKMARGALRFAGDARTTLEQDTGEYLKEEARLLPSRDELSFYLEQVDELRTAIDRLTARVGRLSRGRDSTA